MTDMALLEDEVSQLRSENEYLKITVDALNHGIAELRLESTALLAKNEQLKATVRGWEIDNGAPLTEEELAARQYIG